MKLLQFSAEWCGPCRQARAHIRGLIDDNLYEYIDIEELNPGDFYDNVRADIGVRSLPTFALLEDDGTYEKIGVGYGPDIQEVISKLMDNV